MLPDGRVNVTYGDITQSLEQEWLVNMKLENVRGEAGSREVNSVMVTTWPTAAHAPSIWHRPIINKEDDKEFSGTGQMTHE